jgi:hypothetical protein
MGEAKEEPPRNSFILPNGSYGNRIIYSTIESEWTAVKATRERMM